MLTIIGIILLAISGALFLFLNSFFSGIFLIMALCAMYADYRVKKHIREEEYIRRKQRKADEAYQKSEEGQKEAFEKLPAWKRVELMKQREAENKQQ